MADALACIEPIWNAKRETATRVKQRIAEIMNWAIAKGHRKDNPVTAVNAVLPKNSGKKTHHRALPYAQVPKVIKTMRRTDAQRR